MRSSICVTASVRLMGRVQQNMVLVKGKQTVIIVVMKSTEASTLEVVDGIKQMIPRAEQISPKGVTIRLLDDASIFVKDSISDVLHEMLTAGALVGLIVLLLLGSWRATVIVWTSIPLSILTAIIGLHWLGETINVMTLGGLALAVGILVDNAIVMIENIDRHLDTGTPLEQAIIDAASQIAVPTFVATLCIAIAWFPLFGLTGSSGYLFMPWRRRSSLRCSPLHPFVHPGADHGEVMMKSRMPHPHEPRHPTSDAEHLRNIFVRFQRDSSNASAGSASATPRCWNR